MRISSRINGEPRTVDVPPERILIDLLREDLDLLGTRAACGVGVCGSCTVLLDGKAVSSCLILASNIEGRELVTIEGLGEDGDLDPVQEAFLEHHAFQCGFCTPGMVLAVKALLASEIDPTPDAIRDYLAGNICRCGTYAEVFRAVESLVQGAGAAS